MGRSKYQDWITPQGLAQIMIWRKNGLELQEIAKNMGVSRQTLSEYQKKYPEIADALKWGQQVAVQIVENALFKSAVGYEYEEVTHELSVREEPRLDVDGVPMDGITDTIKEMVETKRVRKYAPPNATSMIFFLKNNDPDHYTDRRDLHHSGNVQTGRPDFSQISTDDLEAAISRIKAAGDPNGSKPSK